ncbi:MAG: hypothetical protein HC828_13695 [Blastochloris sp.]|nr:hypothetical protein [Blastochloris sp.]
MLVGRPGDVDIRGQTVILTIEYTYKSAGLPKGVPTPLQTPTRFTVFIGLKQWRRVEGALRANPDDSLIVEGALAYDALLGGMAVYAVKTTTKTIDAAKRVTAATTDVVSANPRVATLEAAAQQFREKLAVLEALPPDDRPGYEMTRRLLQNTEMQIAALKGG